MTDYRELFGISELSKEAKDGDGVKVAVLDTGIPSIPDILVCLSDNVTNDSSKDSGHATSIGSILFGRGPIKGLCNSATACFIKVFNKSMARPEHVAKAIRHAVDDWHVDIINLSLGFSRTGACPESLRKACEYAFNKDVILVAAAGNDGGEVMWPAALPGVICVGSTNGVDREPFSNHGEIDFVVPGRDLDVQDADGHIVVKSGTSFSTAIITGMLSLILAYKRIRNDKITPSIMKQELIARCKDLKDVGWDTDTGYGFPFSPMISEFAKTSCGGLLINSIFDKIKELIGRVTTAITRRKK